jgi:hypothetical protein
MDLHRSVLVHVESSNGWVRTFETFCVCRNCDRSTIYVIRLKSYEFSQSTAGHRPEEYNGSLNPFIDEPTRYISIRDMGAQSSPEHVPSEVASAFNQGATCLATECWDAAAAMFRKSVDLTTKPMLPEGDEDGLSAKIRRDLGLRLPWLFKTKRLPEDLADLSTCIREDGNDGAHSGALTKAEAEDLLDFTRALLERVYTQPARLKMAAERREIRRKGS